MELPESARFDKRIPKTKFYQHLDISPAVKRCFVEQLDSVLWTHKIAPSTTNLQPGETVAELEVFRLELKGPALDEAVLRRMDESIPYHILFLLCWQGQCQAWIGYKEAAGGGKNVCKVERYYHTGWVDENALPLRLRGLTMDAVYENLVRQVAGDALQSAPHQSVKAAMAQTAQMQKLQKQIAALEKKLSKEKQFNKQVELNGQLKMLRKEWESLQYRKGE